MRQSPRRSFAPHPRRRQVTKIERIRKKAHRVKLVNAGPEHAGLLHEIFTGANTQKYSPVGRASVGELARRLAHAGNAFSEKALFYRFFGEFDGELFGTFILKNIDWRNREGEIGFSLLERSQGLGLGSALVYKCVSKVLEESGIEYLWATVSVTNEASNKLMRRIGFASCGFRKEEFLINGKPVRQIFYEMTRAQADGNALFAS